MASHDEPSWLARLRQQAQQRPRTQFVKARWADIQELLRQRDFLLSQASVETRTALRDLERNEYGRD